jgi:TonB-linked SusC/RagA family outer membrane protein
MYNFYPKKLVQPPGCTSNILLIMRLTTLILITAILQVSANSFAQKVTLSERNAPVNKIFEKISEQTGYDFLVSTENLKQAKSVTINVQNEDLKSALDKIFTGQPLSFVIQEKMVVVSKKETTTAIPKQAVNTPTTVIGKVTDSTGAVLPGATVKIKGSDKITLTDLAGAFTITANEGDVIEVSFIGFQSVFFKVKIGDPFREIVLYSSTSKLNEVSVVSTGYQTLPKERATGSFAQPIKEMYNERVSTDILSRLSGITSGLSFNANTSTASAAPDINIRGRSTIFANDQPLIVVDNFPYSGDINNINPNDVESITILKDAAAASIWGVRAGNGVIVVTTKKGKTNQPLKVGFNANSTVFAKPNLNYNPNHLNASSYIDLETYLFKQGYYNANLSDVTNYPVVSPATELLAAQRAGTISANSLTAQLNTLKGLNVNDQIRKFLFQNATNQQYGLNVSSGSSKATYFFSGGYDYNLSSAKNNSYQRVTLNSQNTFKPIAKLEINVGLNVVQNRNRLDNTVGNTVNHVFPYSQIADASGQPLPISYGYRDSYVQAAPGSGFLDWSYNPLKDLGVADNVTTNTDIRLTSGVKYTFIEGLSGDVKYQYERSNIQNRNFESQQIYFTRNLINQFSIVTGGNVTGYNVPLGGILGLANTNTISNNLRGQLNYNRRWKNSAIAAIAGVEFSQVSSASNGSSFYGYNDDNATFANVNTTTFYNVNPSGNTATINSGLNVGGTLDRIRSSFTNVAYTYQAKYTLSGSARIDGSNYFGVATNQKSLPLWSVGGKWDINKEQFYGLSWLPVLDFRATYGYNGNLDRSVTGVTTLLYQSNALYTNLPYSTILNIGNPDLTWEKTGIANFAIHFSSKNDAISGSLEYYLKKETDVLGYKTFPNNAGIISLEGNYSDMSGRGFDLTLISRNLNGKLKWSTTFLISHATDKVTRYDVAPLASQLVGADGNGTVAVPNLGKPVFGLYSYKWGGLNPSNGNPIGFVSGVHSEDYDAIINNSSVNDLVYSGPARPTYFGGINNHLSYGGFSLDIQINFKLGYYFRKPTINYSQITASGTAYLIVNKDYDSRWMKLGDEKTTNIPSLIYPFSTSRDQFYQGSEVNVEKGDHVRLQDISLSYDFNRSAFPKLPFSNLQLFIYGNNIGILWNANHSGLDPDAVPSGNDRSTIPNPRSIAFGVKGTF